MNLLEKNPATVDSAATDKESANVNNKLSRTPLLEVKRSRQVSVENSLGRIKGKIQERENDNSNNNNKGKMQTSATTHGVMCLRLTCHVRRFVFGVQTPAALA